jgi:hypothetical protein
MSESKELKSKRKVKILKVKEITDFVDMDSDKSVPEDKPEIKLSRKEKFIRAKKNVEHPMNEADSKA